jgi:hypothetical protein
LVRFVVRSARADALLFLLLTILVAGSSQAQQSPGSVAAPTSDSSASAHTAPSPSNRVVLKVGNTQITQAEFESRIHSIEPDKPQPSEKERRNLGDDYASVIMLSQQAITDNIESSPEVKEQLAVARMQVLSDAEFASLMSRAKPSAEEIAKYYAAHPSDYDEVAVRRLFIWKIDEKHKDTKPLTTEEAKARGERVQQAVTAGGDVAKIAQDLKNSNEGLLDEAPITFPRGELPTPMQKVAFGLKEGEWGQVQDTHDSILMVQVVKHQQRELREVQGMIQDRLQSEKMQALLDDLKKKSNIWMDETYFGPAAGHASDAEESESRP